MFLRVFWKKNFKRPCSIWLWCGYCFRSLQLLVQKNSIPFYMQNSLKVISVQIRLSLPNQLYMIPDFNDCRVLLSKNEECMRKITMDTLYSKEVFECVKEHLMIFTNLYAVWKNSRSFEIPFFVGMEQSYSNKTATTLKANATVAYLVQVVLLNFRKEYRWYLIDNGYSFVGLWPVSTAEQDQKTNLGDTLESRSGHNTISVVSLSDEPNQTSQRYGRDLKIAVLHERMQKILGPSSASDETGFNVLISANAWKCHPVRTLYCCAIRKSKDISGVKHGSTAHSCVRCLASKETSLFFGDGPKR